MQKKMNTHMDMTVRQKQEQYFCHRFSHLRKGVTKFGPAPHKLILLLAVIHELEAGRLLENRITPNEELRNSFLEIWQAHIAAGHVPNMALPFFHLRSEGFWHLEAYPQHEHWLIGQESLSSWSQLCKTVQFARVSPELFALLGDPVVRERLRQVLLEDLQRSGYGASSRPCPFCHLLPQQEILVENRTARAFLDAFPVSRGHTLIVPRRHVANYFELKSEEIAHIHELSLACRDILRHRYEAQGFNLGVNVGPVAGQSVFHCHVHVIPRYAGDVANPRGGVRGVIPSRQNYG